ncbi:3814_t:CDS:2 [Gigaspora rosea]|nr:3814_t:CDS:2 [Gigaspora rosea]
MSTTVESSAVSGLLAMEALYENYFIFINYERWSLPHYVATIRENCKYATKDNTYSASLRAWNENGILGMYFGEFDLAISIIF